MRIALAGTAKGYSFDIPKDIYRAKPFDLEHHVRSINSQVEGLKPIRIKKERQLKEFERVCEQPFDDPYLMVIASSPNDMRAKLAAAFLLEKAMARFRKGGISGSLPLWHTITGAFADKFRDNETSLKPSMLILSTVVKDSSNVKVEKLRDLLEQFNAVPRVVVLSGQDPLSFVNTRLFLAMNYCLNISQSARVEL